MENNEPLLKPTTNEDLWNEKDYSNKEMWDVLQEYNKKKKQSVGFNFLGLRERLC